MQISLKRKFKSYAALIFISLSSLAAPRTFAQGFANLVPDLSQGQDRGGVVVSDGSYGGVRVQILQPGSPFASAGIKVGDEITKVAGVPTSSIPAFYQAVNSASGGSNEVEVRSQHGLYASFWVQLSGATSPWSSKTFRSKYKSGGGWTWGTTSLEAQNGWYRLDNGQSGYLYQIQYLDQGKTAQGLWRFENGSIGWFRFTLAGDQRSFSGQWGMGGSIGQDTRGPWEGQLN